MKKLLITATVLTMAALGVRAAETRQWTSDFGPLTLTFGDNGSLTGNYTQYSGVINGNWSGGTLNAYWIQPRSDRQCAQPRGNSYFWGTVRWTLQPNGGLAGAWAYCDQAAGTGGKWNGLPAR
jgi:hypothetical protein